MNPFTGFAAANLFGRPITETVTLTPEEHESLIASVGNIGLGGIALAANILDTPGAIARNTLAGENPFKGLFSPTERTTGRDMLRKWGWIGDEDTTGNWWGGLGAEIVTDPLTFLGSGLTRAGKFAEKVGLLKKAPKIATEATWSIIRNPGLEAAKDAAEMAYRNAIGTINEAAAKNAFDVAAKALADDTTLRLAQRTGRNVGKREARMTQSVDDLLPRMESADATKAAENIADYAAAKGLSAPEIAALRSGKLGSLTSLEVPFWFRPITKPLGIPTELWNIGTAASPTAMKIARGLDIAGNAVRMSPPVRALAGLLNSKMEGAATEAVQRAAPAGFDAKEAALVRAKKLATPEVMLVGRAGLGEDAPLILSLLEAKTPAEQANAIDAIVAAASAKRPFTPTEIAELRQSLAELSAQREAELAQSYLTRKGTGAGVVAEWGEKDTAARYHPRFSATLVGDPPAGAGQSTRTWGVAGEEQIHRMPFFNDVSDPSRTINAIVTHPVIVEAMKDGADVKTIEGLIDQYFGNVLPATYKTLEGAAEKRLPAIANWLRNIPLQHMESGKGLFTNAPAADYGRHVYSEGRALANQGLFNDVLSQPGVLKPFAAASTDPSLEAAKHHGTVSVKHAMQTLGMEAGDEGAGALKTLANKLGINNPSAADITELGKMQISRELFDDLAKYSRPFSHPKEVNPFLKGWDSYQNLQKAFLTGLFPAFHIRNRISGILQNLMEGDFSPKAERATKDMLYGKSNAYFMEIPAVQREAQRLGIDTATWTADDATDVARAMAQQFEIAGSRQGEIAARVGRDVGELVDTTYQEIGLQLPGGLGTIGEPMDWARAARKAAVLEPGTSMKPWELSGVGDRQISRFGPAAAGHDIGSFIEGQNRLAPFFRQLRQGVAPEVAAEAIGGRQVQYGTRYFTPFQRQLLRLFPFGKYTMGQAAHTYGELMKKPGGPLAQTIRTVNRARDPSGLTPDYVAGTSAIPIGSWVPFIGPKEGGDPRYLTGLGMMWEDPIGLLDTSPRNMGLEIASRANPLLKGALEYVMNQSFFQRGSVGGRPLEDLDPTLGRLAANLLRKAGLRDSTEALETPQWLESAVGNSPLSRVLTTARTLTDPRKEGVYGLPGFPAIVNTLTGFKLNDVSERAQDAILREKTTDLMKSMGAKSFTREYIPKELLAVVSPEQRVKLLQIKAIQNELAARSKERKKQMLLRKAMQEQ